MVRPPSPGNWTDRYGSRINPVTGNRETHHGLDIGHAAGRRLVAPEPARLVAYGVVPGWAMHGQVAQLQGDSGWLHWLSHTSSLAAGARVGARFAEGADVAVMGATGQVTGIHVHWETRLHGQRLNPEDWLARFASTPDPKPTPTPDPKPQPDPEEDDDMARNSGVYYTTKRSGKEATVYLLFNTDSGWFHEFGNGPGRGPMPGAYNNALAKALDTPSWAPVTEAHANVIKSTLAAARAREIAIATTFAETVAVDIAEGQP